MGGGPHYSGSGGGAGAGASSAGGSGPGIHRSDSSGQVYYGEETPQEGY